MSRGCRPPFLNLNSLERSQPYLRTTEQVAPQSIWHRESTGWRWNRLVLLEGSRLCQQRWVEGKQRQEQSCTSALSQNPSDLEQTPASTGRQGALLPWPPGYSPPSVPAGLEVAPGLEALDQGKEEKVGASVTPLGVALAEDPLRLLCRLPSLLQPSEPKCLHLTLQPQSILDYPRNPQSMGDTAISGQRWLQTLQRRLGLAAASQPRPSRKHRLRQLPTPTPFAEPGLVNLLH